MGILKKIKTFIQNVFEIHVSLSMDQVKHQIVKTITT